jgi:DHA1 family bicyclomycin/chloramphenicol resistance-like MFS transporter
VLGGWLHDHFGWRSVFWFLAVFGALLLLLMRFVRETLAPELRQSVRPSAVTRVYRSIAFNRRYLRLILTQAFGFAGLFLYIAGAPTVIYDFLGLDSQGFALQFIPTVAGLMLGAGISARLAHRWPPTRTIALGLCLSGLAVAGNLLQLVLLQASSLSVLAPLVLYACGLAVAMPPLTVSALDCFPGNRGSAASVQGFVQMSINAGVAGLAVPLLHSQLGHFVLGQAAFLALAQMLWWLPARARRAVRV